jgi:hypothetical protein
MTKRRLKLQGGTERERDASRRNRSDDECLDVVKLELGPAALGLLEPRLVEDRGKVHTFRLLRHDAVGKQAAQHLRRERGDQKPAYGPPGRAVEHVSLVLRTRFCEHWRLELSRTRVQAGTIPRT